MRHDFDDDDIDDEYDDYKDNDQGKHRSGLIAVCAASAVILGILLVTAATGSGSKKNNNVYGNEPEISSSSSSEEGDTSASSESGLTGLKSQDLTFWDLDDSGTESSVMADGIMPADNQDGDPKDKSGQKDPAGKESTVAASIADEDNPDKTEITHADGSTEYVNINKALKANKYADTGFQTENGIMHYYSNGKSDSTAGADISSDNGDVDFKALKKSGISFVIIRIGSRGYDSGKITLDSKYAENMKNATEAGLNIGVSFDSQALNETEAVEEVNFMLQSMVGQQITYPVVLNVNRVNNDTSRTDGMSTADRTKVIAAFMSSVHAAGFVPVLSGDKEFLLTEINISSLTDSKILLVQPGSLPDYPYQFAMWQYSTNGKVNGIDGNAVLDISMIDFSAR